MLTTLMPTCSLHIRKLVVPMIALTLSLTGCDKPAPPVTTNPKDNKMGTKAEPEQAGKQSAAGKTDSQPLGDGKAPKKYTIAVIPKGATHQFWKSIHAGAIKAERELGNVTIQWKSPEKEDNREQQIAIVENFVNAGVDAIVLAPLDRKALVGPVKLARQRKIPVIVIDSGLDFDGINSYVATDNYNGGAIAAKHMGKLLDGKGNVIVLRYQVGSASTEQREQGFLDTLKKEFPTIKVIESEQFAGATRESALAKAESIVARFGDQINGWFCPCEPVTYGSMRAFKQKNLLGKIKLIGFDTSDEMVAAVRADQVHGLILQDPVNMGYLGVKSALAAIEGKPLEKVVSTGENLIIKQNIDEPKSKLLHSPDLKPWLGE